MVTFHAMWISEHTKKFVPCLWGGVQLQYPYGGGISWFYCIVFMLRYQCRGTDFSWAFNMHSHSPPRSRRFNLIIIELAVWIGSRSFMIYSAVKKIYALYIARHWRGLNVLQWALRTSLLPTKTAPYNIRAEKSVLGEVQKLLFMRAGMKNRLGEILVSSKLPGTSVLLRWRGRIGAM